MKFQWIAYISTTHAEISYELFLQNALSVCAKLELLDTRVKEKGIRFSEKYLVYYLLPCKYGNLSRSIDPTKFDTKLRYAFRDGLKKGAIDVGFGYITSKRR